MKQVYKERLARLKQETSSLNDELEPLKAAWKADKFGGDKIRVVSERTL